jgi:hypothetical protein
MGHPALHLCNFIPRTYCIRNYMQDTKNISSNQVSQSQLIMNLQQAPHNNFLFSFFCLETGNTNHSRVSLYGCVMSNITLVHRWFTMIYIPIYRKIIITSPQLCWITYQRNCPEQTCINYCYHYSVTLQFLAWSSVTTWQSYVHPTNWIRYYT